MEGRKVDRQYAMTCVIKEGRTEGRKEGQREDRQWTMTYTHHITD